MEYTGFFRTVRRRALLIAVVALIGLALSAVAASLITPSYQAKAVLVLRVKSSSTLYERSQFALQRIQSYPALLDSPTLERSVIDELGLRMTPQQLAPHLSADNPENTVLLNVTATSTNADQAAAIANAAAAGLAREVNALENEASLTKNAVALVPQISAQAPRSPYSPNIPVVLGLGLLAGLVVGLILAVLLEWLRPRMRTAEDVRRVTGLPLVALLPRLKQMTPKTGRAQIAGSAAATNLRALGRGEVPPVLLLAPVGRVARQPLIRYLLAWGLSETGRRVVVVETDAHNPPPAAAKISAGAPGLSELLDRRADAAAVVLREAAPGVGVVPAGDIRKAPKQFDVERRFADAVRPIIASHDVTVMQAGSAGLPVPLALAGSVAHGALLVVSRRHTGEREAHRAVTKLLALGIVPIGVVMTDAWGPSGEDLAETWREDDLITIVDGERAEPAVRPLSLLLPVQSVPAGDSGAETASSREEG